MFLIWRGARRVHLASRVKWQDDWHDEGMPAIAQPNCRYEPPSVWLARPILYEQSRKLTCKNCQRLLQREIDLLRRALP